ncbi:glycosyltransferase family 4 protein [Deefgea rivuli]|uniref:glycosyltransferase family 4 protein n=1 Tax=Deefgea rivuli TaxID=400948 RepID=UPI0006847A8F|nr:glycosyltransferase family 4 protein [Deefgea rivuli]
MTRRDSKRKFSSDAALFLESSMNIGGQELQLLQQMSELQQRGWRTRLICKPTSRIYALAKERGLDVAAARFRNALHLPSIFTVRQHLRELNAAAVIVHSGHDANIGAIASRLCGLQRPLIIRMRTYQPGVPSSLPYRYLFDHTLACSAHLRGRILKNPKILSSKVGVLYPGIDFAQIEANAQHAELPRQAAEWLKNRPGPVMLQGAMLREEKGHAVILQAMPVILKQHPQLRFLIAGEGHLQPVLQAMIEELGLQEHACVLGMINPMVGLLRRADLAILPSLSEPFGMFQIEALNLGIPTIASDTDGIPETMAHQEDGLLVAAGDVAAWSVSISWALTHLEQMRTWAAHGQQKNRARFSVAQNTNQLIALIRGAVK